MIWNVKYFIIESIRRFFEAVSFPSAVWLHDAVKKNKNAETVKRWYRKSLQACESSWRSVHTCGVMIMKNGPTRCIDARRNAIRSGQDTVYQHFELFAARVSNFIIVLRQNGFKEKYCISIFILTQKSYSINELKVSTQKKS